MIRFDRVPKPDDFDRETRLPGEAWLAANPDGRPRDFWTPFKGKLAEGFGNLCAYSAMYEPVGTVDHFVSCDEDRTRAYEWQNYRYCAAWINSSKGNAPADNLLDPFEIEDGWFELHLPSLQLRVSANIPHELRDRAEFVLIRLHLRDDERLMRQRQEWYRMYQCGELTHDGLRRKAPLIAAAV
ncbi:MAG: hypothetical protein F4Y86_12825 [Gammaproteobacteria bacterium]|nr:hypothetical protein [Gammaproteobacteria bacterium]MYB37098.1 hypothetical protein [Gammaproteobacteria bacterium]